MANFKKPAPPATPLAPVAKTSTAVATPRTVTADMAAVYAAVAGIENVDPSGNFNYFQPGFEGVVRIQKFFIQQNPRKGKQFVMELILETSNDEDTNPPGEMRSFVQGMEKFKYGQQMLVQVILAILGIDQNDRNQREAMKQAQANMQQYVIDYSMHRDWEAEPAYVWLRTTNKQTDNGGQFTLHVFSPVPAEMMDGAAE